MGALTRPTAIARRSNYAPELRCTFIFLAIAVASPAAGIHLAATIAGLEAEHTNLLVTGKQTPPVLDLDQHLFSWQLHATEGATAEVARNVTQVSATLTLTTPGKAPIVCRPQKASDLHLYCEY